MTVKALQTAYRGYNFRSRLEARWAVFFDALGLQWEYEPEGFELPGGERYLPDFRLRNTQVGDVLVEVKPDSSDWQKCKLLSLFGDQNMLLLAGTPDLKHHTLYLAKAHADHFRRAGSAPLADIVFGDADEELGVLWFHFADFGPRDLRIEPPKQDDDHPPFTAEYAAAVGAARSARFEHGQKGATL